MGKGDKRTKRGKIFRGSYGNSRLRKKGKAKRARRKSGESGSSTERPA
jgi:ribosomal small subunit protein bTHX